MLRKEIILKGSKLMSRIERRYEALQGVHEVWPSHLLHKEFHLNLMDNGIQTLMGSLVTH